MVEGHTNGTTMFLQFMFLICSVCNTHGVASAVSPSCPSDQYRAGQVCCLACPGGYRVHSDCTATTITLCSKCPDGTFKEGLSGQKECSACTKCDPGLGLKEKKPCTPTSDTECEALDGFFCSDSTFNEELSGQKQCSACTKCVTGLGLKVKKRCTPTSDAECEIRDGFFCSDSADKDTLSCQPHTICVGGVQIKPGTDSTDSTCIKYVVIVFIIIGCISFIISLVLGVLVYRRLKMECDLNELKKQIDDAETMEQLKECRGFLSRLKKKKKTQKQQRRFEGLNERLWEKKVALELTELEKLIPKMETMEQLRKCWDVICRLLMENKTTEQQRRFDGLRGRYSEKKVALELTELEKQIDEMETMEQLKECWEKANPIRDKKMKTKNQKRKFDELEKRLSEKTVELELTEYEKQINKMETNEHQRECYRLHSRLKKKNKTPEQEERFKGLNKQLWEKKVELELTELEKLIPKMETPEQEMKCHDLIEVLQKTEKTEKQQRKFDGLTVQFNEETMEQWEECYRFSCQLEEKKKTPGQQRRLDGLDKRLCEKVQEILHMDVTERMYRRQLKETQESNRKLNEWIDLLLKKNVELELTELANLIRVKKGEKQEQEQERELYELIDQLFEERKTLKLNKQLIGLEKQVDEMETPVHGMECYRLRSQLLREKKTPEQRSRLEELDERFSEEKKTPEQRSRLEELDERFSEKCKTLNLNQKLIGDADGEWTSGSSSTPLLSLEHPAGLETSSPPAPSSETQPAGLETSIPPGPSSETQPAEETTPLIPSTSQSIPSTSQSAYRSGAGERDIEMGLIPRPDPKY